MQIKIKVQQANQIGVKVKDTTIVNTVSGTMEINTNGIHSVKAFEYVDVNVKEKTLQEKSVEYNENGEYEITPDNDKVLSKVNVEVNVPIPNGYIKPEGIKELVENGEYDVTDLAKVNVNIKASSSGSDMLQARVDATGNCDYLFYRYSGEEINYINNLKTSNIKSFKSMFYQCYYLKRPPYVDTSNATTLNGMFDQCEVAETLPSLKTENVTDFGSFASSCYLLSVFPDIDTSSATSLNYFCRGCRKLEATPMLKTSNVKIFSYVFSGCYNLKKIDFSHFKPSNTSNSNNSFNECYSLKALIIRDVGTLLYHNAFNKCYHILGTVNTTYNPEGLKDGYVYVPRDRIETLSSATNWSDIATQLRALEDYTVDGTLTGEFDDAKAGL